MIIIDFQIFISALSKHLKQKLPNSVSNSCKTVLPKQTVLGLTDERNVEKFPNAIKSVSLSLFWSELWQTTANVIFLYDLMTTKKNGIINCHSVRMQTVWREEEGPNADTEKQNLILTENLPFIMALLSSTKNKRAKII